ncbi:MAG: S8 family serine peptidase [Fulvivirga sp.]|uniref:Ig-like domain-containing protein n=1 Tax=Fulvivirga sp. TaxID=1931237 RepID=UPI0032EC94FF
MVKNALFIFLMVCSLAGYTQTENLASTDVFRIKLKPDYAERLEQNLNKRTSDLAKAQTGISSLDALNSKNNISKLRPVFSKGGKYEARRRKFGLHLWYEVHIAPAGSNNFDNVISEYKKEISITNVEPVYKKENYKIDGVPYGPVTLETKNSVSLNAVFNDPRIGEQWHYDNNGQTSGIVDADIDLPEAWDINTGSSEVIVSIHDGGIDYDHEDLFDNMWVNEVELNGSNGVDDDGNGYIDDIYGYNFVYDEGNVIPDVDGHGTHVAGTVAAVNNNGIGVAGVAGGGNGNSGISLMSCQVFVSGGGGFAESYAYAADNGAVISQNSWGYTSPGNFEQSVLDAIDYFIANAGYDENGNPVGPMQGGLVIFSSGNSDDNGQYYPGYYEPILAVAATNHNDQKSYYSNFGSWVDIAAPGGETFTTTEGVLSTLPNNSYGFFQGTSMACPHVSGVAALIVSEYGGSGLTPDQVRFRLTETVDDIDGANPGYVGQLGSGRMNAFAALLTDDGIAPDAIIDLSAGEIRHNQITLNWTAPIDEDNGSASSYEIRMSSSPINEGNFSSAQLLTSMSAQLAGSSEEFIVEELNATTTYYFAIKSFDFFSNVSEISNSLEATTSNPPIIEVSPLTLNETLYTGEFSTQFVTISNEGEGVLEYTLALSPQGFTPTKTVLNESPKFEGLDKPNAKSYVSENQKIYQEGSFLHNSTLSSELMSVEELTEILNNLNESFAEITDLIPNPYFFSGGESGNSISDGGNDMYDGGNRISTNLGSDISYTGSTILSSTAFGSESYFTAKYPGLFILSADVNNLNYFEITGNLGADGGGSMDAAVLNVSKGGRNYLGFVKRVYGTSDPSVNHLIIVEDNGSVNHEFSTDTNNDYHRVFDLDGIERVHYLLYASASGGYIDNSYALDIMSAYLELVDVTSGVIIDEISGTVSAGMSNQVPITFDARGIDPGQYLNDIIISSNDVVTGDVTVATELNVEGAPNLITSSESIDLGNVFINIEQDTAFYIINNGNEQLEISNITSANPDITVGVTTASVLPSDSIYIPVSYAISTLGVFEIGLSIASNDTNDPIVEFIIGGTAIEPPVISIDPVSLTENLFTGEESTQAIEITNTGASELTFNLNFSSVSVNTTQNIVSDKLLTEEIVKGSTSEIVTNTLVYPSTDNFGESNILVIQNRAAWGLDLAEFFLENFSINADVINSSSISSTNLSGYDLIITSGGQTDSYYQDITNNVALFESFVTNGGYIQYQLATMGTDAVLAGGVVSEYGNNENFNVTTDFNHPISASLPEVLEGNAANHNILSNLPINSTIISQTASSGLPTTVEYNLGRGKVVATGMTWEFLWINNYNSAMMLLNASEYMMSSNSSIIFSETQEGIIAPNSSTIIEISFDATGLNGGTYESILNIVSNDPYNTLIDVPITLNVTGAADIQIDENNLNFGELFVGATKRDSVLISNVGTDELTFSSISNSISEFDLTIGDLNIPAGGSEYIYVEFTPSSAINYSDEIILNSNDPDESSVIISLEGIGLEPPVISVNPTSLSENLFTGDQVSRTITITNTGGSTLLIGNSARTSSVNNTIEQVYDNNPYLELKSEYDDFVQLESNNITMESNSGGRLFALNSINSEIVELDLESGDIINSFMAPESISLGPDGLAFDGNYLYFVNSFGSGNIYQLDASDGTILNSKNIGGNLFDALGFSGEYIYALDYGSDLIYIIDYELAEIVTTLNLGVPIGGGLSFGGDRETFFVSDFGNTIYEVNTSGVVLNSFQPPSSIYGLGYSNAGNVLFASASTSNTIFVIEPNTGEVLYSVEAASSSALAADEAGSSWISFNPKSGEVEPGNSFEIIVEFDATGLEGGVYESIINIESNDPLNPLVEVPVTLNVTGAPNIQLSTTEINFEDIFITTSKIDSLIIQNSGSEVLNISQVNIPEGFEVQYEFQQMPIGSEQKMYITFNPQDAKLYSGEIEIVSDDPDSPSVTIGVSGLGLNVPVIDVNKSLVLESLISNQSSTRSITLLNTGQGDLEYSISIQNDDRDGSNGGRNGSTIGFYADSTRYTKSPEGLESLVGLNGIGDTLSIANSFYPNTTGMVSVGSELYIVSYLSRELIVYNTESGTETERFTIHLEPYGIAWDGEYLWIGDYVGNVYGYALNGQLIGSFSMPFFTYPSITWHGGNFIANPIFTYNPTVFEVDNSGVVIAQYSSGNLSGELNNLVYSNYEDVFIGLDNSYDKIFSFRLTSSQVEVIEAINYDSYQFGYSISHNGDDLMYLSWDGDYLLIDDGIQQLVWLEINPKSGNISSGGSRQIELLFNGTGLDEGEYKALLTIVSNDPSTPVLTVNVVLNICATAADEPVSLVSPIDDHEIILGDGKLLVDLEEHFIASTAIDFQTSVNNQELGIVEINGPILSYLAENIGNVTIEVEAFDEQCGKASDAFDISVIEVTSLEDQSSELIFYPNPVGDRLVITGLDDRYKSIKVVNMNGLKFEERVLDTTTSEINIDTSTYDAGVYMLIISDENDFQEKIRIVVMH